MLKKTFYSIVAASFMLAAGSVSAGAPEVPTTDGQETVMYCPPSC